MAKVGNLVGIDLGTTFSAIATLDDRGRAITLPNREGEMLTPSAVLIESGSAVVGGAALDVSLEQPDMVATLIKRRMGYPDFGRPVAGREFRPETFSALILRKLVQDAELRIGPIAKAVITVPAYFDDTRRKATKDAGRIAGLDVLDIIDEPTAAALAYSFQPRAGFKEHGDGAVESTHPQTVLVYDLGGGTFDVTLVRLSHLRFETVAIEGDVRLGGQDWDDRIVDFVADRFRQDYGEDPRRDARTKAALHAAAERAKRTLSKLTQTTITCSYAGKMLTVPMTRVEFESLTRDLLTRTRLTTLQLLQEAGMKWPSVDRVLMVGGSSHMPMTGQMLEEISGRAPDRSLAVSEVVARGAALHAGIAAARGQEEGLEMDEEVLKNLGQVIEINVNSHSLGIEVKHNQDRFNDVLIGKNTQLPAAASRVYRTVAANQQRVRVRVLQGDARQAEACINIGECWVDDLPPDLPRHSPIQVRCGCAANGLIDVMALDMTSGKMARAEIHRTTGLGDDDLEREREWLNQMTIQ